MYQKLKNDKIVGYVLLAIGVAIIFFSITQMMIVFNGSGSPPQLFNLSTISIPGSNGQSVVLVTGSELSQFPNLIFWLLLMSFLMFAGGKVASIGVNLIREIKVEVKQPSGTSEGAAKTEADEAANVSV